jgi:hypothetical protein
MYNDVTASKDILCILVVLLLNYFVVFGVKIVLFLVRLSLNIFFDGTAIFCKIFYCTPNSVVFCIFHLVG